uniref:ATP synthase F0 subunit 8 n=1 Tax=Atta sexdens rubropilosa TaxID=64786 RepID=A0A2H4PTR5_9HYME|nr:ATP synthase F0 subunit 8 [Atta sexdens rubropilosa]AWN56120.1 ATP synthase F0 subunit 8 [Atta sexdens rubropilosa]
MPQMMPLMWMFTLIFLSILMLILISFMYFFTTPPSNSFNNLTMNNKIFQNYKFNKNFSWNWLW